jgi:hypothetical protein
MGWVPIPCVCFVCHRRIADRRTRIYDPRPAVDSPKGNALLERTGGTRHFSLAFVVGSLHFTRASCLVTYAYV